MYVGSRHCKQGRQDSDERRESDTMVEPRCHLQRLPHWYGFVSVYEMYKPQYI